MRTLRFALLAALAAAPLAAPASFHLMHVTEVFSNADGTKQFIELEAESNGQGFVSQARFAVQNADGTVTTVVFDITTDIPSLANGDHWLAATAAAQSELGFAADFTLPDNSFILGTGRARFESDAASIVDAVAYGAFTGSNAGFGTPAPALPSDGTSSLTRTADTGDNSADFTSQVNSPTNSAGQTGSIGSSSVGDWEVY